MLEGIYFVNDYKRNSYNKTKLMGKKFKNLKPISHIQKTLIHKNMWKFQTLKIQKTFQN